jgi:hypothetical protein
LTGGNHGWFRETDVITDAHPDLSKIYQFSTNKTKKEKRGNVNVNKGQHIGRVGVSITRSPMKTATTAQRVHAG